MFAVTGDVSDFTIKAIPNTWGTNRETILLYKYVMNPTKDKATDSVVNQLPKIFKYVKLYNISAIVFDETGIGKSSPELFRELLRKECYTKMSEENVFGVEFKAKRRTDILEFYWGRIQSGKEIMPEFPKQWEDEDIMKRMYMEAVTRIDGQSCYIRHLYEHRMFNRNEIKDEQGNIIVDYRQSNYKFLHDDSIFSSAITSYILMLRPDIHSLHNVTQAVRVSIGNRVSHRWKRR